MYTLLALIMAFFAIVMTLKAINRISKLENDIAELHRKLARLGERSPELTGAQQATSQQPTAENITAPFVIEEKPQVESTNEECSKSLHNDHGESDLRSLLVEHDRKDLADSQLATFAARQETRLEQQSRKLLSNIQENWLVWVGAIAMLIGGGYLVQVIGSHIEFSPLMRVSLAFVLSGAMVIAGELFHRKEQNSPERAKRSQGFSYVPAAVTGTGLTGVYCTVIFAFVVYQMLTPSISLLILALAAFSSLALALRQGPLMTALGLIGGYSAPLWIGGSNPEYFLLASYISAISVAATVLMLTVRKAWIAPSIAIPHSIWMLVLIENIPTDSLFSWLAVYLSISLYLIYAVPRMGWAFNPRYRKFQNQWTNSPTAMSIIVALLVFSAVTRMQELHWLHMTYCYVLLLATIWLPAIRKGWSVRAFLPSILVSAITMLVLSFLFDVLYMKDSEAIILLALAICMGLISMRTWSQILYDRSKISVILLLALTPTMTLATLLYTHEFTQDYVWQWTCFTAIVAFSYVYLGLRLNAIVYQCSAVVHALIAGTAFVWLNDTWLTTAISLQVAIIALQIKTDLFKPDPWAVKIAMGILAIRLTLLPFIPEWQPIEAGHWSWILLSYLPALIILAYARSILMKVDTELARWFEGAFLHVFLVALFTQTNYWLTGKYGYLDHIDFTSAVVFANQALIMGLVYSHRSQFALTLSRMYQGYSYLLWGMFAVMLLLLNTLESPLNVDNISAQAMPVFNMLTVGWLLPAGVLIAAVIRRWNTLRIHRQVVAGVALTLAVLWLGMSIRQFWQPTSMTLYQPTSMAELFSYSIAGLMVGGMLTWAGVTRKAMAVQRIGLIVLACVALKVFLWDVRSLDGFWRAVSFLGLGASLIALGWLFQKLNRSVANISTPKPQ